MVVDETGKERGEGEGDRRLLVLIHDIHRSGHQQLGGRCLAAVDQSGIVHGGCRVWLAGGCSVTGASRRGQRRLEVETCMRRSCHEDLRSESRQADGFFDRATSRLLGLARVSPPIWGRTLSGRRSLLVLEDHDESSLQQFVVDYYAIDSSNTRSISCKSNHCTWSATTVFNLSRQLGAASDKAHMSTGMSAACSLRFKASYSLFRGLR